MENPHELEPGCYGSDLVLPFEDEFEPPEPASVEQEKKKNALAFSFRELELVDQAELMDLCFFNASTARHCASREFLEPAAGGAAVIRRDPNAPLPPMGFPARWSSADMGVLRDFVADNEGIYWERFDPRRSALGWPPVFSELMLVRYVGNDPRSVMNCVPSNALAEG